MRSLGYIMGGKPANIDDCIDMARVSKPVRVAAKLTVAENASELFVVRYLGMELTFKFEKNTVVCEENVGGVFSHESEARQRVSIDNANKRLAHLAGRVRELGLDMVFIGAQQFDDAQLFIAKGAAHA